MGRTVTLAIWIGISLACFVGAFLIHLASENVLIQQLAVTTNDAIVPTLLSNQKSPDAYLDGQPLYLMHDRPPFSYVQCLSENFQPNSWMYRSCRFENLCFDLETKTFVLHPSAHQQHLESHHLHNQTFLSSIPKNMISGGQHGVWLKQGRSKWVPEIRNASNATSYYTLHDDTVWISFYPWADCNSGHTLWDSFLPVYTLLEMFDMVDKKLFLTEMSNPLGDCPSVMKSLAPMMGKSDGIIKSIDNLEIVAASGNNMEDNAGVHPSNNPTLVCAKHAANGMGWLTDHGLNLHGSRAKDFANPHNIGRGPTLTGFRNYALANLGLPAHTKLTKPYQVTFSILSSKDQDRRFDFKAQVKALQEKLGDNLIRVKSIAMWNYTLREQIEIATQSSIFVSVGGGGTSPAFFLPSGACLIIYGREGEHFDWDLWNNYANIQVHWLSMPLMDQDIELFVDIIRVQLDQLDSHRLR